MGSNKVLHTWEVPKKITDASRQEFKELAKKAVPRLLVVTTILLGGLYLFFKNVSPEEFDFNWDKMFLRFYLLSVGMIGVTFYVLPWFMSFGRPVYTICEKGVRWQNGSKWGFVKWCACESYSLNRHESFPEIQLLILNRRRYTKEIPLPYDGGAEEIINTVAGYVGMRVSPEAESTMAGARKKFKLSKRQYNFLYLTTFLCSIGVGWYLDHCFTKNANKEMARLVLLLPLLLGGGTIGVVLLFGVKGFKEKECVRHMIVFNFVTWCMSMFVFILISFYRMSKLA